MLRLNDFGQRIEKRLTYQISYSGGLGSAISAIIAFERGFDFNLIFADTLIEDEDLYRFNDEIAAAVGKILIHLKDGRTPWDVFSDKRWIGNTRTAHCSSELKLKPVKKWLDANADPFDPLVLGMDFSEMDRIERAQKNWDRPVVSLLNGRTNTFTIWGCSHYKLLTTVPFTLNETHSTGEPCAGDPPARFGGRGGLWSLRPL